MNCTRTSSENYAQQTSTAKLTKIVQTSSVRYATPIAHNSGNGTMISTQESRN